MATATACLVATLALLLTGCPPNGSDGGNGGTTFPLEGDVQPDSDVRVAAGTHQVDSLTIPAGVTMEAEGPITIEIAGDASIDGVLETASGKLALRVDGDLEVAGTLRTRPATAGANVASQRLRAASDTPLEEQDEGLYLLVQGDASFASDAEVDAAGPVLLGDDPDQLARTPNELNAEAETASGDQPTLVPLPPDDPAFDGLAPSEASSLDPAQARSIIVAGTWDLRDWPGDRPVVLFRFAGEAELTLSGMTVRGPQGVSPGPDDASDDPGRDADGDDGRDGMNLNIWNDGGPINVTGIVTFALTDGGDGADATASCARATGGDGGSPGNFRMTASGGIDIQGTLRIEPGRGGHGGNAVATGQDGCDVEATGGDGANVRKRLHVRGNVQGIDNIEIGDQDGGNGGRATATAGDGADGEECEDGDDGGDATATGGQGGESVVQASGQVTTGSATAGAGGDATATGGEGGRGGDCVGGQGGHGGEGGMGTATGGDAGDETEAASGGEAGANGGAGGDGGNTCGPPDGTGGEGGRGGDASATGGRASGGDRAGTSGAAGDGGAGGDGATPGTGGTRGEGQGDPDDLSDGEAGPDGPVCEDAPPPPPPQPDEDVQVELDFSAISVGTIDDGASYCLPVEAAGETSVDASQIHVLATFDYGGAGLRTSQGLGTQSYREPSAIEVFGLLTFQFFYGACNDPLLSLQATSVVMQIVAIQAANQILLEAMFGTEAQPVDSLDGEGELGGVLEGGSHTWRLRNQSLDATSTFATNAMTPVRVVLNADSFSE